MYEDLALLSQVLDAGSFAKASAATGITKSRLSRRIGDLEQRLGVRLIDRNSRRFVATPIGLELARHGEMIRHEYDAALQVTQEALREPRGKLRLAAPSALMTLTVGEFCVDFASRHPSVNLTIDSTDGMRLPSEDGYDIVLIVTRNNLRDSETIARRLVDIPYELVASPEWFDKYGQIEDIQQLENVPVIGWWNDGNHPRWILETPQNGLVEVPTNPSMVTNNLLIARGAAVRGVGVARLPVRLTRDLKKSGHLKVVAPGYRIKAVPIYAIYRNKRSLLAAGRVFLDELTAHLKLWVQSED